MSPVFRDQTIGESLTQFLERMVQPHEYERKSFGADVKKVVEFLQTQLSIKPFTVAEAGSQKKGTGVRGSSDIDLVVFIHGINKMTDLQDHRAGLLRHIGKKLKEQEWKLDGGPQLTYLKQTKFGVCCKVGSHKVDILLAFDIVNQYDSPAEIYEEMERFRTAKPRGRRRKLIVGLEFSASLSPLQVNFVKSLPAYVKGAIRLLKKWKKEIIEGMSTPRRLIPSYSLEVLATYQWKKTGTESVDQLFHNVIVMLTDCSGIQVAMDYDRQYDIEDFTRNRTTPYILDPVNPFNNTFLSKVADFRVLEREARETLKKLRRWGNPSLRE